MTTPAKLSKQERWILEHSPSGSWDIVTLRDLLPASDRRSHRVQSASLCRSIARLIKRGLVERRYWGLIKRRSGLIEYSHLYKTVNHLPTVVNG